MNGNEPGELEPTAGRPASGAWLLAVIRATCAAGRVSPEDVADVLGVSIRPDYRGYAQVGVLPDGVDDMLFGLDDDRGPVRFLTVTLADESKIPLADLEAALADGRESPPRHPGDTEEIVYGLATPPRRCRVAVGLRPPDGPRGPDDPDDRGSRLVAAVTILP